MHVLGGIDGFQIFLLYGWLGLLLAIVYYSGDPNAPGSKWLYSSRTFSLLLLAALFCARLPTFAFIEFNPDEGLFIAGALKLRHHPIFWQSLDSSTSGPFNYFPLVILNLFGLPLDYSTARLLNLLCTGGATIVGYQVARLFLPDQWARLTALPTLAALMLFRGTDFIHFSSECVPVFLISLSAWLLFSSDQAPSGRPRRLLLAGILIVVTPLAKLQTAPLELTIAAFSLASIYRKREENRRQLLWNFAAGVLGAAVVFLTYLLVFHLYGYFFQSYVVNNLSYANEINDPAGALQDAINIFMGVPDVHWFGIGILAFSIFAGFSCRPWQEKKQQSLIEFIRDASLSTMAFAFTLWLVGGMSGLGWVPHVFFLAGGIALASIVSLRKMSGGTENPSFTTLFMFALLMISIYSVLKPGRGFGHYLYLLVFPLCLMGIWALARVFHFLKHENSWISHLEPVAAVVFIISTIALPVYLRSENLAGQSENEMWALANNSPCEVCRLISQFAPPGASAFVWGWASKYYVLTGTIPATRLPDSVRLLSGGSQYAYYLKQFLDDLRQNPPVVFADAVGPGQFAFFDRRQFAHERIPGVKEYVDANYVLAGDVEGVRVYARKTGKLQLFSSTVTESDTGAPIPDIGWQPEPAWLPDSQGPEASKLAAGAIWASYGGSDAKTGVLTITGISAAQHGCFVVPVAHGPSLGGLKIDLVNPANKVVGKIELDSKKPSWQFMEINYDPAAAGDLRIVAVDAGSGWGQWLAVAQPRSCRQP